jgi:hypothetical protein
MLVDASDSERKKEKSLVKKQRAIFITGSGKCGTSVIAYCFFASGFPMGKESDICVVEGAAGNVKGTWEHQGIHQFNIRILEQNGAAWDRAPAELPLIVDQSLARDMSVFVRDLPEVFCCKEPRLVWTADLWAQYFQEVILIAPFRNPVGFSKSISQVWPDQFKPWTERVDYISPELAIWEKANQRLVDLAAHFTCFWISFDDPPSLLKQRLKSVIKKLGGDLCESAFDEFFVPEARHFSSADEINTSLLAHSRVAGLYRQLLQLSQFDAHW